jgi:hypothetical protein
MDKLEKPLIVVGVAVLVAIALLRGGFGHSTSPGRLSPAPGGIPLYSDDRTL